MMTERREFQMTQADMGVLLDAMQPLPLIAVHCGPMRTCQQRANEAWTALGNKMGFDGMTVKPVPGKTGLFFTAEVKK